VNQHERKKNTSRKHRLSYLETTTDLHLAEALVRDLAERIGVTHQREATITRILTRYSSSLRRKQRDKPEAVSPRVDSRAKVGVEREREIKAALREVGWDIRTCVERKLPLLKLDEDLKALVRSGKLEPSKALVLAQVAPLEREGLLEEGRCKLSFRALQARLGRAVVKVDPGLQADLEYLARTARAVLGTRVTVTESEIVLHCGDAQGVSNMLEQLGVEV
jgi:translation initiation factor 1 (eIF-1/SUI1)